MKIIFLDVDGVLNSIDDFLIRKEKGDITNVAVEDRPLKLLKEIVDETNAKIVVSSSWRIGCKRSGKESIFGGNLYTKLVNRLKDYNMEVYDITPCLNGDVCRGDEIREWLTNNQVDNFIILDDDTDLCEFLHTKHFIKTTYQHGLTEETKNLAIKALNDEKYKGE